MGLGNTLRVPRGPERVSEEPKRPLGRLIFPFAYKLKTLTKSGFTGGLIMGIIVTILGSYQYLVPLTIFFIKQV